MVPVPLPHCMKSWWDIFGALPLAERWQRGMFWVFFAYLTIFPFGYAVREALPVACACCLFAYYRYNWQNSVLRRFGARALFMLFFMAAIWGILISQNVWASLLHVAVGVNKAFVLPFVAMECVRSEKDLRRLVWALVLACCWQGCDGMYQSVTGFDFVDGTPIINGRLTGSLNDYRVGNYMALTLIPAAGLWFMLRQKTTRLWSALVLLALLGPGLYLLYFSYTRNAYLAVLGALVLWYAIVCGRVDWRPLLAVALLFVAAIFVLPRVDVAQLSADGRWDLWRFGWAVFAESPWTGAGFGQYNAAFRALGFVPTKDVITISHPHNIYLQLLCESGVVGLALMLVFLLGMLGWAFVRIRPGLQAEILRAKAGESRSVHWRITALFWCGWGAYLLSGVFGHDFFRDWWQALVMAHLGIMIGAVVSGPGKAPTD